MSLRQSHLFQQSSLSLLRRVPWTMQCLQFTHEFFPRGNLESV
ncbi:hypothetical protein RE6C_04140 [Rhodopirellula europaea 6C]|uniref:Uncharacterized protein n=1 Tax=Rhodopirellula europaea 6C TaxID=1263867 RepID=M2B043_9BACT|nr:hypothetical protein RE6C_04140 [Rhodopirellula europaea 6C]